MRLKQSGNLHDLLHGIAEQPKEYIFIFRGSRLTSSLIKGKHYTRLFSFCLAKFILSNFIDFKAGKQRNVQRRSLTAAEDWTSKEDQCDNSYTIMYVYEKKQMTEK